MTTGTRTRRLSQTVAGLGIAVTLTLAPGTATADTAEAPTLSTKSVGTQVTATDKAIDRAVRLTRGRHYYKARKNLTAARSHIKSAHVAAGNLIGAPPADPESDEPPGPPAVLAVVRLDARVVQKLLPINNGMKAPKVVESLRMTVAVTQLRRDSMLNRVIALPAEGEGGDYADGMADILGVFTREVASINRALSSYHLTQPATSGLTTALHRAQATKAKMDAAFGGGERPDA